MRKAHAAEIAGLLTEHPGILLKQALCLTDEQAELASQAKKHLTEYSEIETAKGVLRSAEENLRKVGGPPSPLANLFAVSGLIGGEAGHLLFQRIRRITQRLYPGLPPDRQGEPTPAAYVIPEAIARELWQEVGSYEGVGARMGFPVALEPFGDGRWRVCRPNGTAYAIVQKREDGRPDDLRRALERLGSDEELRAVYRRWRDASEAAHEARKVFLSKVRNLAAQLRHGVGLRGKCDIGY